MNNNTTSVIQGFLIILVALPLFILWLRDHIRRARAMRCSKIQTARRASAYILGVLFVIIGAFNLWTDFAQRPTTPHPTDSYVFDVVFVIFGSLTWAATRFRYGGGFWSMIGGFLVAGAFAGTVSIIETHMRGWLYDSPVAFYIKIATCWVIGSILLFAGHWRHCKKKEVQPNMDIDRIH